MFADLSVFQIVVVIVSILVSMSFHEAMHSFMAYWLGDSTAKDEGRLSVNPLKHIDLATTVILPVVMILFGLPPLLAARPVPFNPRNVRYGEYGAALVALAGPATNFILAAIAAVVLRSFGDGFSLEVIQAIVLFISVNLGFFIFNILPIPPLDGSRILYAFAPRPLQRVMETIESFGFFAILAFVLILFPIISPYYVHILQSLFNLLLGLG